MSEMYAKLSLLRSAHKFYNMSYITLIWQYIFKRYESMTVPLCGVDNCMSLGNLISLPVLIEQGFKISSVKETSITFEYKNDVIIKCRTDRGLDIGHIQEIFLKGAYRTSLASKNVIDIGMSNGDSAIYFAKQGANKIIGIEPTKESFDLAIENIKSSNVAQKIIAINKGVGVKTGKAELFMSEYSPNGNSLDQSNMIDLSNRKEFKRTVDVITIENILSLLNGETCHLMKMDCEGCEYSVLGNLNYNLFEKIEEIQLEFHNGLQNLPDILKKAGYILNIAKGNKKMGYIVAKKVI